MIKNQEKDHLVVERIAESGDSTSLQNRLKEYEWWYDIADHEKSYKLKDLLRDGWIIVNASVSTARTCSTHGYAARQDHTILMLEKDL